MNANDARITANEAHRLVYKAKFERCRYNLDKVYIEILNAAESGLCETDVDLSMHDIDEHTEGNIVEDIVDILRVDGFTVNTHRSIDGLHLKIYW